MTITKMEKTNMISKSKRTLQIVKHIVINHKIVIITGMPFFLVGLVRCKSSQNKTKRDRKTEQREKEETKSSKQINTK